MKYLLAPVFVTLSFSATAQHEPFFDSLKIVSASNNEIKMLRNDFSFTEGPAADKHGNIYFTDQPNDNIWIYQPRKNKFKLFRHGTGRANGLYLNTKGKVLACADEHGALVQFDKKGRAMPILDNINGKRMNGPNDLWISSTGNIYFTDPFYKRDYWQHSEPPQSSQGVYYLPPNNSQPIAADTSLKQANGIIGSDAKGLLYVADIGDWKTYHYTIEKDGTLSNKTLFVNQGSDGMTIDNMGNIYLTGKGVSVFNKNGIKIAQIPVPEEWTANATFGGQNNNLLFITAGKAVYSIQMNVKGL